MCIPSCALLAASDRDLQLELHLGLIFGVVQVRKVQYTFLGRASIYTTYLWYGASYCYLLRNIQQTLYKCCPVCPLSTCIHTCT